MRASTGALPRQASLTWPTLCQCPRYNDKNNDSPIFHGGGIYLIQSSDSTRCARSTFDVSNVLLEEDCVFVIRFIYNGTFSRHSHPARLCSSLACYTLLFEFVTNLDRQSQSHRQRWQSHNHTPSCPFTKTFFSFLVLNILFLGVDFHFLVLNILFFGFVLDFRFSACWL